MKIDLLKLAIEKDTLFEEFTKQINQRKHFKKLLNRDYSNLTFDNAELRDNNTITNHYKYNFDVYYNNNLIGLLYYETYHPSNKYAYFKFDNKALYNGEWKHYKEIFNKYSNFKFPIHHISQIDLAFDTSNNIFKKYERITRDIRNEIIVNGCMVKDRNKELKDIRIESTPTLNDPYNNSQLIFKDINKTIQMKVYNKTKEIKESSHKTYQLTDIEKKNINDIYRVEISISSKHLYGEYDDPYEFLYSLDDDKYRNKLFKKYSYRLFRYSRKNKPRKLLI